MLLSYIAAALLMIRTHVETLKLVFSLRNNFLKPLFGVCVSFLLALNKMLFCVWSYIEQHQYKLLTVYSYRDKDLLFFVHLEERSCNDRMKLAQQHEDSNTY